MRSTIELDDDLVKEAMRLASMRTKREVVGLALLELVASRMHPDLQEFFGSDLIADDYKEARAGRSFGGG